MAQADINPGDPVIEVNGLVTYYGRRRILDQVDFLVQPGEIRVIMGGSGSGKSTLLRHLLGLLTPAEGSIKVLGRDINRLSPLQRLAFKREIGVSFQGGALF
ncbi:MAG: ATP-binding cassette domain-containing protein, partial [Xanthomonadales bacterium]|nr:ATP-binding cassette domain-containing protein [Xanthomonadales bacterium]